MNSVRDIHWLAGLLEGEGCFGITQGKSPIIQLKMTDQDVVVRAAEILGTTVNGPYVIKSGQRVAWQTAVCRSRAIQWMMTLLPLMASRRRAKIIECIELWKRDGISRYAKCHPARPDKTAGLCGPCYNRKMGYNWRRRMRRLNAAANAVAIGG